MRHEHSAAPWLGDIPTHWRVMKVGLAGSILMGRQRAPQYEKGDHMTPYLRVANVLDGFIDYSDILEMNFEPEEQSLFAVSPEDILLNEGQSRELVGRSAIYRGEPNQYCFQNTLIRFRVGEGLDPEFAQMQFASWLTAGVFQLFCRQSTNIAHLGAERFAEIRMAVPPIEEQRAIVAYLVRETAHVDALVAAKQRVLDLLAEKRKAIIATAVTRGLDPKVKLRDSGVPWLGEIPAHWEFLKFSWCVFIAEGQVDPEDDKFSSWPLIAPNHIESGTGRLLGLESAAEQGAISGKYRCHPGDVIYSKIRPALRKATIAPQACLCSADMYPMRVDGSLLISEYLLHYLLTDAFSVWAVLESNRVAMPKINRESLIELRMPVPPHDEQRAIVEHIVRETAKLDAVRAATERTIALLKERRAALIAAAVTGQLDVGAAA